MVLGCVCNLRIQVHLPLNIVNLKLPKTKETAARQENLQFFSLLDLVYCQRNVPPTPEIGRTVPLLFSNPLLPSKRTGVWGTKTTQNWDI